MLKVFIAQYLNMAVVALVAFGKIDALPQILQYLQILQGSYTDFNSAWYGNVGSYLMLTFILQSISAPIYPLAQYYIIYPFCRFWTYPSIRYLWLSVRLFYYLFILL